MTRGRGKLTPQDLEYMKIISANINRYLAEGGYRQIDLVRATNIPASTLTGYVKGTSLPIPENVQKIADFFDLFKSDIDPRFKDIHVQQIKIPNSPLAQKITETVVQLHTPRKQKVLEYANQELLEQNNKKIVELRDESLYEYKVFEKLSAGSGFSYFGDGSYDVVLHNEKLDHDFASWIFGDSMEPTYLNGEVVLIKQTGYDYDGAIYAVEWDGQTYVKKVYKEEKGLRLVSINKKYSDKFAPYDEEPRIIGKIVGHFLPREN